MNHQYFRRLLYAKNEAKEIASRLSDHDVIVEHTMDDKFHLTFYRQISPEVYQWLMDNSWVNEKLEPGLFLNGQEQIYVYTKPVSLSYRTACVMYLYHMGTALMIIGILLLGSTCIMLAMAISERYMFYG